ncbi:MAG: YgiT-type zinc finger protein [bacterium]
MVCAFCGGRLIDSTESVRDWIDGEFVVIKNVPLMICERCGGKFYPEDSLNDVDDILGREHCESHPSKDKPFKPIDIVKANL